MAKGNPSNSTNNKAKSAGTNKTGTQNTTQNNTANPQTSSTNCNH